MNKTMIILALVLLPLAFAASTSNPAAAKQSCAPQCCQQAGGTYGSGYCSGGEQSQYESCVQSCQATIDLVSGKCCCLPGLVLLVGAGMIVGRTRLF